MMALALAALGGCSTRQYLAVNDAGDRTALPAGGRAPVPPPPVQPTPVARLVWDQCGAGAMLYLVGKQKSEIPVANDPTRRRVVCTTCPMTQDYRPERQTILYDEASKAVVRITCG